MKKIKVLHIITGTDNGGGGNHVLNLCSRKNKKFENVLGCVGEGLLYEKAKKSSVNHILFKNQINNKEIIEYVENNFIDIINFHGAKAFLIHHRIKRKLKIPTAASVHSDYRKDFLNNKLKYIFFTHLSAVGLKSFKNYICISQNLRRLLENKGFEGKKYVINNGIDMDKVHIKKGKSVVRLENEINDDDFVICMVARMHPVKNHISIIEAFYKLNKEIDDIKLLFVGDGELKEQIVKRIEELQLSRNIIITGFKENPLDYINASDVSILASFSEGGAPPLAVLESGAVGIPIICTKVGDLENMIHEPNGILVQSQNSHHIYEGMKKAVLNRDKLSQMGKCLQELVVNNYTMEKFWESYYKAYYEMIYGKSFIDLK